MDEKSEGNLGTLSPALEAAQIKRLKELYLFLHPETKNGTAGKHRPKTQVSQFAKPDSEPADRFAKVEAVALSVSAKPRRAKSASLAHSHEKPYPKPCREQLQDKRPFPAAS